MKIICRVNNNIYTFIENKMMPDLAKFDLICIVNWNILVKNVLNYLSCCCKCANLIRATESGKRMENVQSYSSDVWAVYCNLMSNFIVI